MKMSNPFGTADGRSGMPLSWDSKDFSEWGSSAKMSTLLSSMWPSVRPISDCLKSTKKIEKSCYNVLTFKNSAASPESYFQTSKCL